MRQENNFMESPLIPELQKRNEVEQLKFKPITVSEVTDYEISQEKTMEDKLFNTQRGTTPQLQNELITDSIS